MNLKKATHPRAIQFQKTLSNFGINAKIKEFSESTSTAQEAADAIGCKLGQIVKSLIFKGANSGEGILVLTSGKNRVDKSLIHDVFDEELTKADADFVKEQSGYSIRSVPPFGLRHNFRVVIDQDLGDYDVLWAAAGSHHAVFPISFTELCNASLGIVSNVKEER